MNRIDQIQKANSISYLIDKFKDIEERKGTSCKSDFLDEKSQSPSKTIDEMMVDGIHHSVLDTDISIRSCKESLEAFDKIDKRKKTQRLLTRLCSIIQTHISSDEE